MPGFKGNQCDRPGVKSMYTDVSAHRIGSRADDAGNQRQWKNRKPEPRMLCGMGRIWTGPTLILAPTRCDGPEGTSFPERQPGYLPPRFGPRFGLEPPRCGTPDPLKEVRGLPHGAFSIRATPLRQYICLNTAYHGPRVPQRSVVERFVL